MNIYRSFEDAAGMKNPVVTTGSFDGVHVGHRVILARLKKLAAEVKGETALITFWPHPRKVLYPASEGKDLEFILTQNEKIELLRETGLDNLLIIPFTPEFARTSSMSFVQDILLGTLHARVIVVGFNHHFGFNREGDYSYLHQLSEKLNFLVEEIPMQEIQHESVSSTKIRRALKEGNIQRANAYLDSFYFIGGTLESGSESITRMGFPTFTLSFPLEEKLIPPEGVYAVRLKINGVFYKGMCSIKESGRGSRSSSSSGRLPVRSEAKAGGSGSGSSSSSSSGSGSSAQNRKEVKDNERDTLFTGKGAGSERKIEFHLFDKVDFKLHSAGNLYFHKRVRDFHQFEKPEELRNQLILDRDQIWEMIF
jgi:riboflavin kinase/FMN adenylyltransferase